MRPVIFTHMPKACGTTLIKLLHRWYAREEICEVGTKLRAEHIAELRARPNVSLVMGHAAFGLYEAFGTPARYITVLREPVARAISHFHYAGRTPGHPLYERIRNGEMNLLAVARYVASLQTRYVSGRFKAGPDERTLELAKENIVRHFAVASLAERFDESVVLLHRIFTRKLRPFASENVGPRHSPTDALGPGELRELRAHHELDYRLYDFARARLDEQIARQDDTFARQVAGLRIGNRVANLAVRTLRRVRPKGKK
jgi:hypothetical protein